MAYGREPTASEVLDVMDRLQRDRIRRDELTAGSKIFRVCAEEGLLNEHSIDWLAELMQAPPDGLGESAAGARRRIEDVSLPERSGASDLVRSRA